MRPHYFCLNGRGFVLIKKASLCESVCCAATFPCYLEVFFTKNCVAYEEMVHPPSPVESEVAGGISMCS